MDTGIISAFSLFRDLRLHIKKEGWSFVAHFLVPIFVICLSISKATVLVPNEGLFGKLSVFHVVPVSKEPVFDERISSILLVERGASDLNIPWDRNISNVMMSPKGRQSLVKLTNETLHISSIEIPWGQTLALLSDGKPKPELYYRGQKYATDRLVSLAGMPVRILIWSFIAAVFGFGLFMSPTTVNETQTDSNNLS